MAFPTSPLSQENVLRDVHDPVTQRLRVDTEATIVAGAMEVLITDADDSVKIGDGNGQYMAVNPDGSINVTLSGTTAVSSTYNEITSVSSATLSTIVSVVIASTGRLQRVPYSGNNIAEYSLLVNGNVVDKQRTYFGGNLNGEFTFDDGIMLFITDVVELKVVHNRPDVGDFNGRIQVAGV